MPFCLNCGKEVPAGAKYCGNCGAPTRGSSFSQAERGDVPEPRIAERAIANSMPKGIKLLVALSLVASVVVVSFGTFLFVVATLEGASIVADIGIIFIILGLATFIPRYGYSNAKSWGRKAGSAEGVVYALLGLFLMLGDLPLQAVGATSLAFGVANLYYLRKAVAKAYFAERGPGHVPGRLEPRTASA
jgi:hypothetical protein